jgi:FkbM family methyltransferase
MGLFYPIVDRILFGEHKYAIPLQTVVQHFMRGPRSASFTFRRGPAKGLMFFCSTSEKYYFERSDFERSVGLLFESIVKPEWVIYEVGGHIGYWAVVLSQLCGEKGQVHVFEPSRPNFSRLHGNLQANGLRNVTPYNLAVSEQSGPLNFSEDGSMSRVCGANSTTTVQAVRLDDFMRAKPRPDLILVDAEFHGDKVLRGGYEILRQVRPDLVYETHDAEEERKIGEILLPLGYRLCPIDRAEGFPKRLHAKSNRSASDRAATQRQMLSLTAASTP